MSVHPDFPDIPPSLYVNFANSQKMDSRFTFVRDCPATYIDQKGMLRYAQNNEPRFEWTDGKCEGLLMERSRSNYVQESGTFTTGWQTVNARLSTSDGMLAPDGVSVATRLIGDTTSNSHGVRYITEADPNQYFTGAVFAKAGDNITQLRLRVVGGVSEYGGSTGNFAGNINLINGSIMASLTGGDGVNFRVDTKRLIDGWWRIQVAGIPTATTGKTHVWLDIALNQGGTTEFAGDDEDGIYIWGGQLEPDKTYSESYVPTTSTWSGVLPRDACYLTGEAFDAIYRQDEATFVSHFRTPSQMASNSYLYPAALLGPTNADRYEHRINIWEDNPAAMVVVYESVAGSWIYSSIARGDINSAKRVAATYRNNDTLFAARDDTLVNTSATLALPQNIKTLQFASVSANPLTGDTTGSSYIRSVAIYPRKLNNAQARRLTRT